MENEKMEPQAEVEPAQKRVPFFARYLESQSELRVKTGLRAGCGVAVTLKFPSDAEDGGGGAVTLKFPSDTDEG